MKADTTYVVGQTVSKQLVDRFRSSADNYIVRTDTTFLEIILCEDDDPSIIREEKIPREQIKSCLDVKSPVTPQTGKNPPSSVLRLMVAPFNEGLTGHLPESLAELASALQFFGFNESYIHDENLQGSPNWCSIPLENNLAGFVIKTEVFDSDCASFSLALVADFSSGRISGILHVMLKDDLKRIKDYLMDAPKRYSHDCMALPLLLTQLRTSNMPNKIQEIRTQLYETEKRIGSHKNYQHKETHTRWGYYARGEEVWKREGFDAAGGELTSMVSDCVMLESKAQLYTRLLDWIGEMHRKFPVQSLEQAGRPYPLLNEKIRVMKGNLEHCRIRSEYLGRRAEAQVQACAGIMSQRDNANSLKASRVALRDSNDMRAISLVTMFFLPGTFMATLFSTGFFSFQQDGRVVSHWIWLYWIFTGGLTGIALGMFAVWNRHTERRLLQERAGPGSSGE